MATIEDSKNHMTVYFRKKTGDIKQVCTGIQDMAIFGEEQEDYEMIWDLIVVEVNQNLLIHSNMFYIDIQSKILKVKEVE